ncbi:EamA family transporter RarD [Shewanella sp. OPT22]|uniref:EamA family transporter RarD n=1 Tax=Parashewanella hymeniacidonis TaxID=2807618 RepID=UPI00102193AA|nr:EamA family transporter RarD [Parashewanella hymeniacidonis]MBM7070962.1 EamA family transporter RarD [Parashewanella hymeniacidonis]RYV03873.1 EamA family transporter RarD [Shewanella sp. OPT22]
MPENEHQKGVILAIFAYTIWGIAPLYFKLLEPVPAPEILLHRVIWSFVFMIGLLGLTRGFSSLKALMTYKKKIAVLSITSVLIAFNWLLFIWAVNNEHMLDASLGYFINPLFNVVLGLVFLSERLSRLQWFAVALALTGVVVQLISFGSIPIVSLALAGSFSIYGLLRKKAKVDAQTGLLVETALLIPVAILYVVYLVQSGQNDLMSYDLDINLLLLLAGVVTSIPLLCFAGAAIRIPLSMLGFFQYIGPSLMFILATMIFKEPFGLDKAITFGFIWAALIVFTADMWIQRRGRLTIKNSSS